MDLFYIHGHECPLIVFGDCWIYWDAGRIIPPNDLNAGLSNLRIRINKKRIHYSFAEIE